MRLLFFTLFISVISLAHAKDLTPKVYHSIFGGCGNLFLEGKTRLLQLGYHTTFEDNPVVIGIENNFYFNRKQYDWPGIDKYRYQKVINITTVSLGLQIARKERLYPFIGLCYNQAFYDGELKTSNPLLKSHLVNHYYYKSSNVFFLVKLNYRISKKIGAYVCFNRIKLKKDLSPYYYLGFGLNYHFNKKQ